MNSYAARFHSSLAIFFSILQIGCANTELLRQSDYAPVQVEMREGNIERARERFPEVRERGGFVTTIEKGYLNFLNRTPEPVPLVRVSEELDRRKMILISKEANQFFYQETEDGYFPAEHEIIWLHLVAGFHFAQIGDRVGARVEAKRAAEKLQGHGETRLGDFDDPSLRILLASLWIYCDEWEHAAVDLRRAAELSPQYLWARKLANADKPPANLVIVLQGTGPEPAGERDRLKFQLMSSPYKLKSSRPLAVESTAYWFARHQLRNTAIREVLDKSRYMIKSGAVTGVALAGEGGAAAVAGSMYAGAIALGTAVVAGTVYLFTQMGPSAGNSGEALLWLATGGLTLSYAIWKEASSFHREKRRELKEYRSENLDVSRTYRFVRFIPDWIATGASDQAIRIFNSSGSELRAFSEWKNSSGQATVKFYFIP